MENLELLKALEGGIPFPKELMGHPEDINFQKVFSRYKLLRYIGKGILFKVYEAFNTESETIVAVKIL